MAKVDPENARKLYPSVSMGVPEWMAFFNTPEGFHAMGRIIGDIYNKVKDEEAKERGVHRMGRRVARAAVPIDEVYAVVFPAALSHELFPSAFRSALNGRSQNSIALKAKISQGQLSKLVNGDRDLTFQQLEALAEALGVRPGYFVEYRALYVSEMVQKVMTEYPNVGITVFRRLNKNRRVFDER